MLKSSPSVFIAIAAFAILTTAPCAYAERVDCDAMLEIRDCLAIKLDRAETDIAQILRQAEAVPALARGLQSSQQIWLKFRDSHCALESSLEQILKTDPVGELTTHECLARMTEERSAALSAILPNLKKKRSA